MGTLREYGHWQHLLTLHQSSNTWEQMDEQQIKWLNVGTTRNYAFNCDPKHRSIYQTSIILIIVQYLF